MAHAHLAALARRLAGAAPRRAILTPCQRPGDRLVVAPYVTINAENRVS